MRRCISFLTVLISGVLLVVGHSAAAKEVTTLEIGAPPELELPGVDGKTYRLTISPTPRCWW